jgi:hypothetical protein
MAPRSASYRTAAARSNPFRGEPLPAGTYGNERMRRRPRTH